MTSARDRPKESRPIPNPSPLSRDAGARTTTAAEPALPRGIERLAFLSADTDAARAAARELAQRYGSFEPHEADVIVALGGDGLMLQTLHKVMETGTPVYGMNRGSVGFLMNDYAVEGLPERLLRAAMTSIRPLTMTATDTKGERFEAKAINEVSLLRQTHQTAKFAIEIDGHPRLDELICDGVLVATPAGSTAYNLSAHGPILPINAQLLALTPISAFRPRRWRGALLPSHVTVTVHCLEVDKRPIAATADHVEIRSVACVDVCEDKATSCNLLFDPDRSWDERILAEQFTY